MFSHVASLPYLYSWLLYEYSVLRALFVGSVTIALRLFCGLHCGFTSAQYCDIHGVHSQHSRCLQPFKKQDRLSHTDCTEKKQHSPSTTLHDKGEQNTEQVVGYTATAWLCMYAYKTAAGWSAIRRGRRDAVLCEDRNRECAAWWMDCNRTCRAHQNQGANRKKVVAITKGAR